MQPSPYTPGEIAHTVPGRGDLLAEFEERLSWLIDLQRLVGRIHVTHGERGIGKTSLLRAYQRRAEARGALAIWVTAGDHGGLIAQLLSGIRDATRSWPRTAAAALNKNLDSISVSLGIPGIASITATNTRDTGDVTLGARDVEKILRAVTKDRKQVPALILFIDEVQSADRAGIRTLAYAWQHLQADAPDVPVAIFAAGLPNAPEHIAAAATFSERFAYRPLHMLSEGAQVAALSAPAAELGVRWHPDALALATQYCIGYPYLVQLYGDASWVAAGRPDAGSTITASHVTAAKIAVDRDMEALFSVRWANATRGEQKFLIALAWLQQNSDAVSRAQIASSRGLSTSSLSHARSKLLEKGLIQAVGHGTIRISIPGFAEFVRGQAANPHPEQ